MNTPIHDFLTNYAKSDTIRCHMPGGKGENNPFDITEINGADSLFECNGIIYESEKNASSLFGTGSTLFSCGGSTLAVQGMLATLKGTTDKSTVIAGRYCHKSLINSCILLGFDIKWAYPKEYLGTDIDPEEIERLIDEDTAAVFINSIDYYGGEADISAVSEICRKHNIPFLVDNAHGAYRVFTGNHPIALGADMSADSAHKTLPVLTGGAYLHLKNPDLCGMAKNAMNMFGSSSPSYLIMDSLDLCNAYISEKKAEALQIIDDIAILKGRLTDMGYKLKKSDPMRITIDTADYGYNGNDFGEILRNLGAECEMCDENYIVLLFSVAQDPNDLIKLYKYLDSIEKKPSLTSEAHIILRPERMLSPRKAYYSRKTTIKTKDALGKICGGIHTPCPPCVPLIMPGERIDKDVIRELIRYGVEEVSVVIEQQKLNLLI